jgi:hypothetical protein
MLPPQPWRSAPSSRQLSRRVLLFFGHMPLPQPSWSAPSSLQSLRRFLFSWHKLLPQPVEPHGQLQRFLVFGGTALHGSFAVLRGRLAAGGSAVGCCGGSGSCNLNGPPWSSAMQ